MAPLKRFAQELIRGYQSILLEKTGKPIISRPIIIATPPQFKNIPPEPEREREKEPEAKTSISAKYKSLEIPRISTQSANLQNTAMQTTTKMNIVYPLVPRKPARGENILAYDSSIKRSIG